MSGACVKRARLHAADGSPMPTKHTSSLLTHRDAATVINSSGEYVTLRDSRDAPRKDVRTGLHDVLVDPTGEAVAIACDGVPCKIKRIVACIVAVRVGRECASR